MAELRTFLSIAITISTILVSSAYVHAYPLPVAPNRYRDNAVFNAYNARFGNVLRQNPAFVPQTYFSKGSGSARVAGGMAPDADYVCSLAYITMTVGGRSYSGSGVLISNYAVLTAAHNFDDGTRQSDVRVYLGDVDGGTSDPVAISNIYRLSGYRDGRPASGSDLAIVELRNFQPNNCLIHWQDRASVNPDDGDVVTFLGYGRSTSSRVNARGESDLRQASLRIAENGRTVAGLPACADQSDAAQVICAVSPGYPARNSAGTCLSDSGGPLIKDDGWNKWVVGVNSYSNTNCDAPGNVDMFARVYPHRAVIEGLVFHGNTAGWNRLAA